MGWKSTRLITREQALELAFAYMARIYTLSDDKLEDFIENIYGDNIDLPYYGNNFSITTQKEVDKYNKEIK